MVLSAPGRRKRSETGWVKTAGAIGQGVYIVPFNGVDLVAVPDGAGLGVCNRRRVDISGFDGEVVDWLGYGNWRSRNRGEGCEEDAGNEGREGCELDQHYGGWIRVD